MLVSLHCCQQCRFFRNTIMSAAGHLQSNCSTLRLAKQGPLVARIPQ